MYIGNSFCYLVISHLQHEPCKQYLCVIMGNVKLRVRLCWVSLAAVSPLPVNTIVYIQQNSKLKLIVEKKGC